MSGPHPRRAARSAPAPRPNDGAPALRICTFELHGFAMLGCVAGDRITVLARARCGTEIAQWLRRPAQELVAAIDEARRGAGNTVPLSEVSLLAPVPLPGKILCVGWRSGACTPRVCIRTASSLVAPGEALVTPLLAEQFACEAALAVMIGARARRLEPAQALQAVVGYSCFTDGTVYDFEQGTGDWSIVKNFDATGVLGPWVVPAGQLPPGAAGLALHARINGETVQRFSTTELPLSVAETLCMLTEAMTLEPGDIVVIGAPPGAATHQPSFVKGGDHVEVEIEGIGVLASRVTGEAPGHRCRH